MKIAIDAGHGKETAGKRTPIFPDGYVMRENYFNKAVAKYLKEELKQNGFDVLDVSPEDGDTPLSKRVNRANSSKVDLYISIHANAFSNVWNNAQGIETFVYSLSDKKTMDFAKCVHDELITHTGRKNRGIKENSSLYVLNSTKMSAILVECGFMTNLEEANLLRTEEYRKKCATAICKGVCKFAGVKYKSNEKEVKTLKRFDKIEQLPYGKETIKKMIDKNLLFGDKNGNLNLSDDMLRIFMVMDRLKNFD